MNTQTWIDDRKDLLALLPYEERGIVSKQILRDEKGNAIVFSIYEGERLVSDSYPNRVLVVGLEGKALLSMGDESYEIGPLVSMTIPSNEKYTLRASSNCKVLIVLKI